MAQALPIGDQLVKRAIGIVRVSRTAGREGEKFHSPEIQRERIEIDCERWGLELIDVFDELDVSGGKPLMQRPGVRQALEVVESGRAEAIVFAYRDRVDRSIDTASELCRRMDAAGALLLAGGQQITHATHDGWRHATLESFLNEDQRRAVAAKIKDVHVRAVATGKVPFPMPTGYRRRPDGTAEIDPVTGPLIRQAFEMRAAGAPITEIVCYLKGHGIKLSVGGVLRVLERRFYLGELHFGKHKPNLHAHDPLVTPEVFDAVQARKGKLRGRRSKSPLLLARLGILRCESCGGTPLGANRKSTRWGSDPFYRCTNPTCTAKPTIMAKTIEPLVIARSKELLGALLGSASLESNVLAAKKDLDAAQDALSARTRVVLAAGLEDEAEAVEGLRRLKEARNEARRAYDEALAADSAAHLAINAEEAFEHGSLESKRELIQAVIEAVWVRQGRTKAERAERVRIVGRIVGRTL